MAKRKIIRRKRKKRSEYIVAMDQDNNVVAIENTHNDICDTLMDQRFEILGMCYRQSPELAIEYVKDMLGLD